MFLRFCPRCGNLLLVETAHRRDPSFATPATSRRRSQSGARASASASAAAADVDTDAMQDFEAAAMDIFNATKMRFKCRCCPYTCDIVEEISESLPELDPKAVAELGGRARRNAPQRHEDASAASLNDIIGGADSWKNAEKTSDVRCETCGCTQAYFFQVQTRSADEPTTVFYKCVKCGNRWNDR